MVFNLVRLFILICVSLSASAADKHSLTVQQQVRAVSDFVDQYPALHTEFEVGMLQTGTRAEKALDLIGGAYLRYLAEEVDEDAQPRTMTDNESVRPPYPNSVLAWARNICFTNHGFKGSDRIDGGVFGRLLRLLELRPELRDYIVNQKHITKTQAKALACDVAKRVYGEKERNVVTERNARNGVRSLILEHPIP